MSLAKSLLSRIARNSLLWSLLRPLTKAVIFMNDVRRSDEWRARYQDDLAEKTKAFAEIVDGRTVLNGPFRGMKYASLDAHGSALFAKLVGSYEREIQPLVEQLCLNRYDCVVNVGCGEGYYAVGFALRGLATKVFAFDLSEEARDYTLRMAKANGVQDIVSVDAACSAQRLIDIVSGKRCLIVCDCEGCELDIFQQFAIQRLKDCDVLIETHDFLDIHISGRMLEAFAKTHTHTSFKSIDDIEKANLYNFEETKDFDLSLKRRLFEEGRPAIMQWLFFQPRASQKPVG